MEHLSLYSSLDLIAFCDRLSFLLDFPTFEFDSENETEWRESKKGDLIFNVSRPFKKGTLQEWDDTVPDGCNFGITITKRDIELDDIKRIGKLIADEFKTSVYYHRTWAASGVNIKREIEIKTSFNSL